MIGASGGVFGLDGAFMSLFFWDYLFGKRSYERPDIWFFIIGVTLIIDIVVGFRSDISMSGHISGFVIGAIVVWIFRYLESKLSRK